MPLVFIGIGSNLGERTQNCTKSVELLSQNRSIQGIKVSKWREFDAITVEKDEIQPKYINGAVSFETDLSPEELLNLINEIENKLGRKRTGKKWEPRTIDLDILFYGNLTIKTPILTIPHPELHKRRFVLEPLYDIAPDYKHPILNKTIKELL